MTNEEWASMIREAQKEFYLKGITKCRDILVQLEEAEQWLRTTTSCVNDQAQEAVEQYIAAVHNCITDLDREIE